MGCPHQAHECRTLCAQMPCLPNDFAKQSIVSYIPGGRTLKDGLRPSVSAPFLRQRIYTLIRERYDGAFLGALRPLFLGVEHRGQYEPPQRTEKADVGSRTRQVVLTEPCGSVSVIRWIIATLRVLLVASLPEMRTAHALACPLMGYVCRFVAM